ncbi:hypothetical protein L1049_019641 [Liquidambar formosana]|uniref:Uncharacterized protein n=1 Tax=Liquidambar formosana TaxID=63359 RepID=A0AAP0SBN0_LIQFO
MGENGMKVKEVSPSSSENEGSPNVIQISSSSSSSSSEQGTPLRPIFCLKKKVDMKEFEETEDCFILDFDPFEPLDLSKLSVSKNHDDDDHDCDISVVAERGQSRRHAMGSSRRKGFLGECHMENSLSHPKGEKATRCQNAAALSTAVEMSAVEVWLRVEIIHTRGISV